MDVPAAVATVAAALTSLGWLREYLNGQAAVKSTVKELLDAHELKEQLNYQEIKDALLLVQRSQDRTEQRQR